MVEELLERFSAVVSDVCACLMEFKVCPDYFWREKLNLGLKLLSGGHVSKNYLSVSSLNKLLQRFSSV